MSNTTQTTDSDFDSTEPDRAPGHPIARLKEADKQMSISLHDLQTESEHVDPDPIQDIQAALDTLCEATETLEAQARQTDTELNGGAE